MSREVDRLFRDIKYKFEFCYLDDLLVYSKTREDHVSHLGQVSSRLKDAGFTLYPEKVVLGVEESRFLGHVLSVAGLLVNPERV